MEGYLGRRPGRGPDPRHPQRRRDRRAHEVGVRCRQGAAGHRALTDPSPGRVAALCPTIAAFQPRPFARS
ncbi:hypothetical protein CBM2586_A10550 [Cupriavidus phytorum]|uniref:Uncharacterized protein n=1 Tax=Cupriavidus taiwanensis TaxID=164546 RepID=A0A975WPZ3_9BURK|nr:hypothetical protein CBM2586_A10550 [Cupriavidus taiwanensis]